MSPLLGRTLLAVLALAGCRPPLDARAASPPRAADRARGEWTVLFYGANDNSSEETVVHDLRAMQRGLPDVPGLELIALVDRSPRYSSDAAALGEDFSDTRLYRLRRGGAQRIGGGVQFPEITTESSHEANTGDPLTLERFIRFGKATFPARRYALVIYSHGDGRRFGFDESHGNDTLEAEQLARGLAEDTSVDLLGLDVCSMGGLANAWRWRPGNGGFSAGVLVASAPTSGPWPYERILPHLSAPASVEPRALAEAIVEELRQSFPGHREAHAGWFAMQSWAAYDLTRTEPARRALDALVDAASPSERAVLRALRGPATAPQLVHYGPPGEVNIWPRFPYVDLYDFAAQAAADLRLGEPVRGAARGLAAATDDVVLASFGGGLYPRFAEGRHGLWIDFPEKEPAAGLDPSFCAGPRSPWCNFLGRVPAAP